MSSSAKSIFWVINLTGARQQKTATSKTATYKKQSTFFSNSQVSKCKLCSDCSGCECVLPTCDSFQLFPQEIDHTAVRHALKIQVYLLSFWRSNLISCQRVASDDVNSQFYLSFCPSNLISCERVATDGINSQFYPSFWRSNLISCESVAFSDASLALPRALREK